MLLARTRVEFIFNTLLKVAFISGSIRSWRKRGEKLTADYGVGKFQEFILAGNLPTISFIFLVKVPPLVSTWALRLITLVATTSPILQYKPRHHIDLLTSQRTPEPPNKERSRVWFLFQVRVCVKRQIVFSPCVACGVCSNALDGRTIGRYDCEGLCSCLDVS